MFAIAIFWGFGFGDYLELEYLKSQRGALAEYYRTHFAATIAAYFFSYIVITALSLPGAAVLTLAGGALFGFWLGTVLVSFASTIGASLAFFTSRFLLRDSIQARFGEKLNSVNEGLRRDGAFYLFTLRLIPLFPFFLINLLMGLTEMPVRTYFFVSQIGMLPGTAAYVNAGTQLGEIESLSGIVSWQVLLSFAVLGILPLVSKAFVSWFQRRKALEGYERPKKFDYNVVVIGAGSAGLVAAYIAAALKAKVALIEKHKMGGDCLNTGCVPSKALIRSAKILSYVSRAGDFGCKEGNVRFEFPEIMERVQKVVKEVAPHDSVERYSKLGVECFSGTARIISPYVVEVEGRRLSARSIVIAAGASPLVPHIPGLEQVSYYTSDTIWNLRKLPERLLVLGGGPIGVELAQSFSRFGSKVTIVEMLPRLLPQEDEEVSHFIMEVFRTEGISVLVNHKGKEFRGGGVARDLLCDGPRGEAGGEISVPFDEVLIVLGRRANTSGFGLETLGIELAANGTVAHDEFLCTKFPNIFVCGDVAGPYQFTHTASHQAWFASVNALFHPLKKFRADYRVIPWCTFSDPEIARVGLSEIQAKARGIEYEVTRYSIDDLDRAIAESENRGFIKVLTPKGSDKILGAVIVGPHAGDIIAEYVLAMKHGLGLKKILGTIHIYPTFAEAVKFAAGAWQRAHAPKAALGVLERVFARQRAGKRL